MKHCPSIITVQSLTGRSLLTAGARLLVILALLSGTGCTGLRSARDGRHLYTGQTLRVDSSGLLKNAHAVRNELEELIPIRPNHKFLWMRPQLCLHNLIAPPEKEKGFWYWMKYKLGEAPVFIEDLQPENLVLTMENRLQNHGHFRAVVTCDVDSGRKTASLSFRVMPGKPYPVDRIVYPAAAAGIQGELHSMAGESLVKPGDAYDLDVFVRERIRIDSILKERGYYYFSPEYLLFIADTSAGNGRVIAWLKLKDDIPPEAGIAFRYRSISVADDFSLKDYRPDTLVVGNFRYLSENHLFEPGTVLRYVYLEKDSLYARSDYLNTVRSLVGVGLFKFAALRFSRADSADGMKASLLLTPYRKISLSAEMNANIKTTGYAGPGVKLSYKNRNFLGGAELFDISLSGNFETQTKGNTKGQTSYQVALDASLTLPRFVPFSFGASYRTAVPKTIFTSGIGVYSRVNLYDLQSFNVSLGYNWRSSLRVSHLLQPAVISFTKLANSTAEFEEYLKENPNVRRSFEEQFILGSSYTFQYSNFNRQKRRHSFYVSESIDLSGNLAHAIANLGGPPAETGEPKRLLGVAFSQFIRLRNEERYFYRFPRNGEIGFRFVSGVGIPYKNSSTMPYNRQYFAGGTSSIRAFLSRSLGPGTYQIPDSLSDIAIDQAGDITLESSLEFRFTIIKSFKGAVFTDVGNIWLVNEDPQRVGGQFRFKTFYKELAVGAGFGFRFDWTFIILRFDLAMPLRKPWLPEGERWVIDEVNVGSSSWRKDNLVLNLAIGYPF